MPGREKDWTMRTVSSPLTRGWVERGIAYGTVPRYVRKTMNPSNTEKRLDDSLVLSRHNLWGEKWNQQLSATICCGLTKSLNIQGEKLIIADEVIYFKTIRRAVAGSASNDKARHSLLNKTICCSQEVEKPLKIQTKVFLFITFRNFRRYYLKRII